MTVSENNFTPGEMLIAAREKASLSLDEIAESTRIAPNMLRAIELDEYHKISGDLYVKSFLRSYADAVGLEPEDLIELYLVYTGTSSIDSSGNQPASWEEQDVKITKIGLPWGWILLGVAVIAAGWFLVSLLVGKDQDDAPVENVVESTPATTPAGIISQPDLPDSTVQLSTGQDTLSLGWQLEPAEEIIPEESVTSPPPGSGKVYLPRAYAGNPRMSFDGGKSWAYIVRLICDEPGEFAVKRDAESSFSVAAFPTDGTQPIPLPSGGVEAGRAYAVRRGYVIYWGADDHLSLRLGHIKGVDVSFNEVSLDVSRFRDGEEILLDSSRLAGPTGN